MGAHQCLSHGGVEIEAAESCSDLSQLSCIALTPLEEEESLVVTALSLTSAYRGRGDVTPVLWLDTMMAARLWSA